MTDAKQPEHIRLVEPEQTVTVPANPFANLDALRNPQDYEEFLGGETTTAFAVKTLRDAMHLRVNPDPAYTLLGQYVVNTKQGAYFVYPQFRDALGPLPTSLSASVSAT